MKVTVNQSLLDVKGDPLRDEQSQIISLKDILLRTCLADIDKDESKKLEDFNLFLKLQSSLIDVELSNSELLRLQEKAKKSWSILVYGQINNILEGKENPIKKLV